jgi:O-methyltransferase
MISEQTKISPLEYAKRIAYSSEETLQFTYESAKYASRIEGDLVECGVAAGAQIIAMLHACKQKKVWAFDSFMGIPLPSNKDDQMPGIKMLTSEEQEALPNPGEQELISSGATLVSHNDFLNHIVSAFGIIPNNLYPVKGWFEETIPNAEVETISMLRLDGDLYHSTYVCLENLFHKVVKDGIVIIDDIQLPGCQQACVDYFKSIGYTPDYKYVSNIAYFLK